MSLLSQTSVNQVPRQPRRRVVVTGLGAVTPIGNTASDFWQALLAGQSGIDHITAFDTTDHQCKIAGEVKGFDPHHYMDRKEVKRAARFVHLAAAAAIQAVEDANFKITELNAEHVGVIIGTGIGGIQVLEDQHTVFMTKGPNRCSPFMVPMMIANMAAAQVAILLGAKGPNTSTVTACASGSNAIGDAFQLLQRGEAQVVLAGGTEAAVTPLSIVGFAAAKTLSLRNQDPTRASRPFDKDRQGFVMGEGAGVVLLEELDHAKARGARIYAEIVGYGRTCDAYHITAPAPEGHGAARCIVLALKDADLLPTDVNYINAHGTGTLMNDSIETLAVKKALGDHAYATAISSTKSMTGHLMGGAGGIEAVASVLTVHQDQVPPTVNLDQPSEDCDLDYVPNHSRAMTVNVAISNSFGFGGHNATLVFRKYTET